MITFEEAFRIITSNIPVKETERIHFQLSAGRVLAEDIHSDLNMPPFDKAAVDGYACRRADLHQPMQLLEVIAAGRQPEKDILPGCCSKIMTGAMLPKNADCVVMVEHSMIDEEGKVIILEKNTKNNIAYLGEDISEGEKVLTKGLLIKAQHIAVLAAAGAINPLVYKKVITTIMSTGDELVEPDQHPVAGKIRNSNGSQLVEQLRATGAEVIYGGIVPDDVEITRQMISNALKNSDVIILSGGISMGDFDYIPAILKELGFQILFQSLAVQPGKPTVFARSENKFILGLPGNPVSSFNIFELLGKPFLYRLMGHQQKDLNLRLPLAENFSRKGSGRLGFVPALLKNGMVVPIHYHGSAHINALVNADVLFSVPLGISELHAGDLVDVRFI